MSGFGNTSGSFAIALRIGLPLRERVPYNSVPMIPDNSCTFGNQIAFPHDICRCTMGESLNARHITYSIHQARANERTSNAHRSPPHAFQHECGDLGKYILVTKGWYYKGSITHCNIVIRNGIHLSRPTTLSSSACTLA